MNFHKQTDPTAVLASSGFVSKVIGDLCIGCGTRKTCCQFEALSSDMTVAVSLPTYLALGSTIALVGDLYGAKILSIARNRSGRLPVIIMDDTSQDISSTNRSGCVTYWPRYRKVLT